MKEQTDNNANLNNPFLHGKIYLNLDIISPSNFKNKNTKASNSVNSYLDTAMHSLKTDTRYDTESRKKENRTYFNKEQGDSNIPIRKISIEEDSLKPTLTSTESRNRLFDYSKSKKFEEDENYFASKKFTNNEEILSQTEELDSERIEFKKKIDDIIKSLPVPLEKKNDEKFKLKAMKKMKSDKTSANKSAKQSDVNERKSHQDEFKLSQMILIFRFRVQPIKKEKTFLIG